MSFCEAQPNKEEEEGEADESDLLQLKRSVEEADDSWDHSTKISAVQSESKTNKTTSHRNPK